MPGLNRISSHQIQCKSWKLLIVIFTTLALEVIPNKIDNNRDQPKIIIVGAGVSGIAAASRLIENGFTNLKILEAEGRIGGRVNSVKIGNWTVDLGGHWVHGESGNAVYDIAAPLGLLDNCTKDFTNGITIFSDKTEQESLHDELLDYETLNTSILLEIHNESVYHFFQRKLGPKIKANINDTEKADAYLKWILEIECILEGCDSLKDVSTKGSAEYEIFGGSSVVSWKGKGYQSMIDLLLRRHEKSQGPPINLDGKLQLNSEVISITNGNDGVQVQCKNGTIITADFVIVTISLAVLKNNHITLFHPPLPDYKRKAIEALGMGTVDKIILRFPHVWWPEDVSGFEIIWLEKDRSLKEGEFPWEYAILSFDSEDGSPFTLTAWITGEAARSMENHSIEDVTKGAMRVLRKLLSHKYSIPDPVEVIRSRWGTNPHFRGSYSYRSMASESMNVSAADLAKPLSDENGKEVIFFAGEASSPHHFSTVHGALETGWREADRIIKKYKNLKEN